jgi:protein-tyrosine phosphatase
VTGRERRAQALDADPGCLAHALEDLPAEVREQAAAIAATQPGLSLRKRVEDALETLAAGAYGVFEQAALLRFLARYPVTPYTYQVSPRLARGQRPDAAKLSRLFRLGGYRATVNLCAEMAGGDGPAIAAAGLTGVLRTCHVPVTDMEPPTVTQLTGLLDLLSGPAGEPTYLHCEAGKGRTGVVVACYRMAVAGWSPADALTEAVHFGCFLPGQQAFIREYGDLLRSAAAPGGYPLRPPGSAGPTPEQLTATVATAADPPSGSVHPS